MKTFIIDDNVNDNIIKGCLLESFFPTSNRVILIKKHLDKNFVKNKVDDIDANGMPCKSYMAMLIGDHKQPLKSFKPQELLVYLDDKFHNIIKNNNDRNIFLKQVLKDWFNDKISKEGVLSVNFLK